MLLPAQDLPLLSQQLIGAKALLRPLQPQPLHRGAEPLPGQPLLFEEEDGLFHQGDDLLPGKEAGKGGANPYLRLLLMYSTATTLMVMLMP